MPEGYWVKRASVPGKSRTTAASAASSNYVYISGGMHYGGLNTHGSVLQDILRYNPNDDNWQYIAIMPKKLMNHNCFTINDTVYFGLGENEELEINDQLYYFAE
jgi:N-acetylneuraminic acid mutarotase